MLLETTPEQAWERVSSGGRPLANDQGEFWALFEQRTPLYEAVADGHARDVDGVVLAAAGIHVWEGALDGLGGLAPGDDDVALVADERVDQLYGNRARTALGSRLTASHVVPAGERSKTVAQAEALWSTLRLDRAATIAALGGGSTSDLVGFVAASYLRGIPWVAVPTTLVGQADAAIGGKTGIDLERGKNLVGAFHWPARVIVDPGLLESLPPEEHENGLAEVVKTGLLAGEPLWELETGSRCVAARRSRRPSACAIRSTGAAGPAEPRAHLRARPRGGLRLHASARRAVALGLLAALRLSGLDDDARVVAEVLKAEPVEVDRDAAWTALAADKKAVEGRPQLVLLEARGRPKLGVELDPDEIRAALDALIA